MQQHGFELVREQDIPEINSRARLWRHLKTGAQLLSLENDDENKCFSITFTTLPSDSTGVPHILEHAVLNGSRKYPVKEPFVELLKSSLASFINAMTFPDKTVYPVASTNLKDFYNLIDVYLDAVFFPRITPEILMQEGWHYELEGADAPLTYKGVVFNEMKGAYSSPDNLLGTYTQSALYPDTVYAVDSGGDPQVIPNLTYEQFKGFHETYYHPSNARIIFYGDDDPVERLRLTDAYLSEFDAKEIDTAIALQPAFDEPIRVVREYDAGEEDDDKGLVTVSWLLPEPNNLELTFALEILDEILLGTPAAPLYKALIDSGLGEDLTGGGLQNWGTRQLSFSTGLKGIAVEDAEKVETLIIETLRQLAKDGIDPAQIEAALNSTEFEMREFNTGGFPRGLAAMFAILTTWLYDGDPLAPLIFEEPLRHLKERLAAGERVFESLIEEHFLQNNHRSTVLLRPDPEWGKRLEAMEQDRLAKVRDTLSEADIQRVIEETMRLRELQETPDTPEALASIPSLTLDDLDRFNKTVPLTPLELSGSRVIYHDLFTNGIVYVDIGFNLMALPQDLLPLVGLFSTGLLQMGTETEDFVRLSQRIGSKTGGIDPDLFISQMRTSDDTALWLFLRGKSTVDHTGDLLDILRDILLTTNFDNQERFMQLALEAKARYESGLIPAGHRVVSRRLAGHFHLAGWASEQISGFSQLAFVRGLIDEIDNNWPAVLEKLEALRAHLLRRDVLIANVTLDEANWNRVQPQLSAFIASIPMNGGTNLMTWQPTLPSTGEGMTLPAQVNYVGMGANIHTLGYILHGSNIVINKFLSRSFLWDRVRVQGGAYGVFATYDPNSGLYGFASYRDPNLLKTLENYRDASTFLRNLDLNQTELTKAIVGGIGEMDQYQLPDAKGYSALKRYLTNYTDEIRQTVREELLATTLADFKRMGEALAQLNDHARVVVLGSQQAIESANQAQPGLMPTIIKAL
ncbi:MAG: insulinase family protein [Anaerolineae bacterium]